MLLIIGAFVLSLKVTPQVCQEPCAITATIVIEGVDEGRDVCLDLTFAGDNEPYTRSCWPHSGRRSVDVKVSRIPAGSYAVGVTAGGHRASTTLQVIGESPEANTRKNARSVWKNERSQ